MIKEILGATYVDELNRIIYVPFGAQIAYVISKDKEKEFNFYNLRIAVAAFLTSLISMMFQLNLFDALLTGIGLYIVITLFFHFHLLSKLQILKKFKVPTKENYLIRNAKSHSVNDLKVLIICCLAFLLVLAFSTFGRELDKTQFYSNLIFIVFVLVFTLLQTLILITKQRKNL